MADLRAFWWVNHLESANNPSFQFGQPSVVDPDANHVRLDGQNLPMSNVHSAGGSKSSEVRCGLHQMTSCDMVSNRSEITWGVTTVTVLMFSNLDDLDANQWMRIIYKWLACRQHETMELSYTHGSSVLWSAEKNKHNLQFVFWQCHILSQSYHHNVIITTLISSSILLTPLGSQVVFSMQMISAVNWKPWHFHWMPGCCLASFPSWACLTRSVSIAGQMMSPRVAGSDADISVCRICGLFGRWSGNGIIVKCHGCRAWKQATTSSGQTHWHPHLFGKIIDKPLKIPDLVWTCVDTFKWNSEERC